MRATSIPMRSFIAILGLGAACVLASCASQPARSGAPMSMEPAPAHTTAADADGHPRPDLRRETSAHARIDALWAEIEDARDRAGLAEPLSAGAVERMADQPVTEARASCEPPAALTTTCQDVCTLATAICDNAESICRLADELAGDEWAEGKCRSATAACAEATQRCCGCF